MNNPNKICMVSIHTENFNSLADITWNQNKMLYCQKKGYDSVLQVQSAPYEEKHKYLLIKSLVDRKKYDYIFWCDCDTLVTNFSKNIEEDLEFARRTEVAWKQFDEGKFVSKSKEDFLKELSKI